MLAKWTVAASCVAAACAAHAQDVSVLGGVTRLHPPTDTTYGYHVGYTHDITPWLAASGFGLNTHLAGAPGLVRSSA